MRSAIASIATRLRFEIYFTVSGSRYLPVDNDLALLLSEPPLITAPRGMHARVLSSVCHPQSVTFHDLAGSAATLQAFACSPELIDVVTTLPYGRPS